MDGPTRFGVVAGEVAASGGLIANKDAKMKRYAALDMAFPMYPEGSVELLLPVKVLVGDEASAPSSGSGQAEIELTFTYMACSTSGVCKLPVTDKRLTVTIPNEFLQKRR